MVATGFPYGGRGFAMQAASGRVAADHSEARQVTQLDEIAASHLDRLAELDPGWATTAGRLDHETELTDRSPAGIAERVDLARSTLAAAEAEG